MWTYYLISWCVASLAFVLGWIAGHDKGYSKGRANGWHAHEIIRRQNER